MLGYKHSKLQKSLTQKNLINTDITTPVNVLHANEYTNGEKQHNSLKLKKMSKTKLRPTVC